MTTKDRLFGWRHAFDHPVTLWITAGIAGLLVVAPLVVLLGAAAGKIAPERKAKVLTIWKSWLVIAPLVVVPILAGAAFVIAFAAALALACNREYARVTGLFRERGIAALTALAILLVFFAVADHWYGLFMALWPLSTVTIAGAALFADRPKGYIQRVALAVFAVLLFGGGLGHLAYFANDALFRPLLLWLIAGVELNDVFAFTCGRLFGRGKLCPNTSPNKTVAGSVGAFVCTTVLVGLTGHFVFEGTPLDAPVHLAALGAIVSVAGQFGDLTLSSIKRDVGIKDTGTLIPGHGGLLDRFDSLLLAAPAVFHYVGYFRPGVGLGSATHVITGP